MNTAESRLKKTLFIVEATSFEMHMLWERHVYKNPNPLKWEQMDGWLVTVGHLKKRPCCISVFWVKIDNQLIMFWYPTSQFVDHLMIDKWLGEHFCGKWDNQRRRAECDANNFYHCISAIKEKNTLD